MYLTEKQLIGTIIIFILIVGVIFAAIKSHYKRKFKRLERNFTAFLKKKNI